MSFNRELAIAAVIVAALIGWVALMGVQIEHPRLPTILDGVEA